jgi:ectoine hydroxylase-related dioxygenase (phytanoyl-CoA dioxygenase family)
MAPGTFDEAAAVDLELQPGQMSLHDVYMIHGATANTSGQRRTGVALATCRPVPFLSGASTPSTASPESRSTSRGGLCGS